MLLVTVKILKYFKKHTIIVSLLVLFSFSKYEKKNPYFISLSLNKMPSLISQFHIQGGKRVG